MRIRCRAGMSVAGGEADVGWTPWERQGIAIFREHQDNAPYRDHTFVRSFKPSGFVRLSVARRNGTMLLTHRLIPLAVQIGGRPEWRCR